MFQILIPTINRQDLLNPTLEFYLNNFPNTTISVFDNGSQQILSHERINVMRSVTNLGVAGSWNSLIDKCLKVCDFGLVLNDDVRLLSNESEVLDFLTQVKKDTFYFGDVENKFQSFLISKDIWHRIGIFDISYFPAYWEDDDYVARLKMYNYTFEQSYQLRIDQIEVGGSSQKDKNLQKNYIKNKKLYLSKWGSKKNPWPYPYNKTPSVDDILIDFLSKFKN